MKLNFLQLAEIKYHDYIKFTNKALWKGCLKITRKVCMCQPECNSPIFKTCPYRIFKTTLHC